jgi:hypothetical protein
LGDFASAIRRKPKPIKMRQGKIRLAALLSRLGEILQAKVVAPDLKDLFDAVANEKNRRDIADTDLPDDPETLAREVRMERPKVKVFKAVKGGKKSSVKHSG